MRWFVMLRSRLFQLKNDGAPWQTFLLKNGKQAQVYNEGHSLPITISVTATDVAGGTIVVEGLVSHTDESVMLEIQTTSNRMNKSEAVQHRISIHELQTMEFKRRPIGSKIILEAKRLETLAKIPGVVRNRLGLNVARKYRIQASDFVTHVQILLTEIRLEEI